MGETILDKFRQRAKNNLKKIVLPEGEEIRNLKASIILQKEALVTPILIGNKDKIFELAKNENLDTGVLEGIQIVDPESDSNFDKYASALFELRKAKGMTEDQARATTKDPVYYGTLMVYCSDADGLVSGAIHSPADTIRPALQILKTAPGVSKVSGAFLVVVPNCSLGSNGLFVFADCAVNPNPTSEDLATIAVSSAKTARILAGIEPKVALLSFSTKGSAKHEFVDKVAGACNILKEQGVDFEFDGELQADASLIESVAKTKAKDSSVAGHANVLVFPDLQSGNISYKLVERLARAQAIGPILQGIRKPVNDLSRGCSVEDIVNVCVITSLQAGGLQ